MLTSSLALAALLAAGPCTLIARTEAATVTGKAPTTVLPYGPEADPETKASVTWCVMSGAPVGIIVYVDTYATAANALKMVTRERILSLMDSDVTVEPEPGLGDRAFWAHSDTSARMVVIRGAVVMSMVIGGVDLTKAARSARRRVPWPSRRSRGYEFTPARLIAAAPPAGPAVRRCRCENACRF